MEERALPGVMRIAAGAWVVVALYVFVVEGVLDAIHLWAPYLGIVLWTPIWLVGLGGAVLVMRGVGRRGGIIWSLAATVVAGIPAFVVLMDLDKPGGVRTDGLASIPLAILSLTALVAARRR